MTDEQRAELRAHVEKFAAEAPPVSDETADRLAILLQPAIQAERSAPAPATKAA